MLEGLKTFILAAVMLVCTTGLIWKGILPATAWGEAVQWVAIMVGARELADKGIGKFLNKPSQPPGVDTKPGN